MKYIKSYKIFESIGIFPNTKKEIDDICYQYMIDKYTINDDMSINVDDHVDLYSQNLIMLPLKFNYVDGDFNCANNQLTSLEGSPKYVKENFHCSNNLLSNLNGCPNNVSGYFSCTNNKLTNLEHLPTMNVYFNYNPIHNLIRKIEPKIDQYITNVEPGQWPMPTVDLREIIERLDEFEVIKDNNKIDLLSLEQLFAFYKKDFNVNEFKKINGYETY